MAVVLLVLPAPAALVPSVVPLVVVLLALLVLVVAVPELVDDSGPTPTKISPIPRLLLLNST